MFKILIRHKKLSIKTEIKLSNALSKDYNNCHLPRNAKFNYHLIYQNLTLIYRNN